MSLALVSPVPVARSVAIVIGINRYLSTVRGPCNQSSDFWGYIGANR